MRMLKFPNDDYLYHWTKGLAARGDMVEVDIEIVKEEAPQKKAGRPKRVDDE